MSANQRSSDIYIYLISVPGYLRILEVIWQRLSDNVLPRPNGFSGTFQEAWEEGQTNFLINLLQHFVAWLYFVYKVWYSTYLSLKILYYQINILSYYFVNNGHTVFLYMYIHNMFSIYITLRGVNMRRFTVLAVRFYN